MANPLSNFSLRELQNLQEHNNKALRRLEAITIWFWRENARAYMHRTQVEEEMQYLIPGSQMYCQWQNRLNYAISMEEQSSLEYVQFQQMQGPGTFRRNLAIIFDMEIESRLRLLHP